MSELNLYLINYMYIEENDESFHSKTSSNSIRNISIM